MNKYHEIMEKVTLSDEAKASILSDIEQTDLTKANTFRRFSSHKRVFAAAACIAILLVSAGIAAVLQSVRAPQEMTTPGQITECKDLDALSDAVGFEIKELTDLPFQPTDTVYTDYSGGLAEIAYMSANQVLYYRMSPGSEDNSGDYTVYDSEQSLNIDSVTVTLKGNGEKFLLAVWTDGDYSYSISLTGGISKNRLTALVQSAIK